MAYGLVVEYYCLCRQDFSLDTDTDTDTVTVGGDRLGRNGQSVIAIISTMAGGHRYRSWFSGCCCCTVIYALVVVCRSAVVVVGLHNSATHVELRQTLIHKSIRVSSVRA